MFSWKKSELQRSYVDTWKTQYKIHSKLYWEISMITASIRNYIKSAASRPQSYMSASGKRARSFTENSKPSEVPLVVGEPATVRRESFGHKQAFTGVKKDARHLKSHRGLCLDEIGEMLPF
jgi:hypothetical protein